jgi:hypothetical protein
MFKESLEVRPPVSRDFCPEYPTIIDSAKQAAEVRRQHANRQKYIFAALGSAACGVLATKLGLQAHIEASPLIGFSTITFVTLPLIFHGVAAHFRGKVIANPRTLDEWQLAWRSCGVDGLSTESQSKIALAAEDVSLLPIARYTGHRAVNGSYVPALLERNSERAIPVAVMDRPVDHCVPGNLVFNFETGLQISESKQMAEERALPVQA